MQDDSGKLQLITQQQFKDSMEMGKTKVLQVGDVFKVRGCYFRVQNIESNGIYATGITRREYYDRKRGKVAMAAERNKK